jgi:glutathione peroxidase
MLKQVLRLITLGTIFLQLPASAQAVSSAKTSECTPLLNHAFKRLQDEAPQQLCQYQGKVILAVNTASYCGFTSQYQGLEALYAKYRERGLVVLGFPSNDFGWQEPGTAKQIADLCYNTYGVKFPMFSKTPVSGSDAHPFYSALAREAGGPPRWNFHKYLIGRDGKAISGFGSSVKPEDAKLTAAIEKALSGPL